MLDLWNVRAADMNGDQKLLHDKINPEDLPLMKEAINLAIKTRGIFQFEYRLYPSPGQEKIIYSRGRCKYAPDSQSPISFFGIVTDISLKHKYQKVKSRLELIEEAIRLNPPHQDIRQLLELMMQDIRD
jgi:hypothetical protein